MFHSSFVHDCSGQFMNLLSEAYHGMSLMIAFQDLQTTAEFPDHLEELRAVLLKVKNTRHRYREDIVTGPIYLPFEAVAKGNSKPTPFNSWTL